MKRFFIPLASTMVLGSALALAAPALAQDDSQQQAQPTTTQQMPMRPSTGPARMGPGPGYGMMGRRGRGACHGGTAGMMGLGRGTGMMTHPDGTLAFLKAELKITEKQMSAWTPFAQSMRDSAGMMRTAMQSHMTAGAPKTLMERLDRHEAMMTSRLEALRSTKEALGRLYVALDDQQKQKLDAMARPCRRGQKPAAGASDE